MGKLVQNIECAFTNLKKEEDESSFIISADAFVIKRL